MKTATTTTKFESKKDIFYLIAGSAYTRKQSLVDAMGATLCDMMQVADEQGSFVADIIDRVLRNQSVTDKQAWAVAYWAERNGYVK